MNDIIERLKDMKSTLPGTLGLIGVGIALFKDIVGEVVAWVQSMGYTLTPDTQTVLTVVVGLICIKMIFFEGGTK